MKTVLGVTLVTVLALGAGVAAAPRRGYRQVSWWSSARAVPVAAYANGNRLGADALMLKGLARTVLPMRVLFTALGAHVDWHSGERAVYAWKSDGTGVRFVVGKRKAETLILTDRPSAAHRPSVSETRDLDAPPMLIGNAVYIPVRAATEALGAEVRWDGSVPAIYLSTQPAAAIPETPDGDVDVRALSLSLDVGSRRVRSGRPVLLRLTLANIGERAITVPYVSGQRFDFTVSKDGLPVWNWAHGRVFTEALTPLRLMPGEKTSFTTTWNQSDNAGLRVRPGAYEVRAQVVRPRGRRPLAVTQRLTITR